MIYSFWLRTNPSSNYMCFPGFTYRRPIFRQIGGAKEERGGVVPIGHKQRHVAQAMTQATPIWPKSGRRNH